MRVGFELEDALFVSSSKLSLLRLVFGVSLFAVWSIFVWVVLFWGVCWLFSVFGFVGFCLVVH